MARNEYIGKLIGASLGRVEEVDIEEGAVEWGEFMQVRVHLDITKPLIQCKKMTIGSSEPVSMSFTYERLLDFCFCCGIMGHNHKACPQWLKGKELYDWEGLSYGSWLKTGQQRIGDTAS